MKHNTLHKKGSCIECAYKVYKPEEIIRILENTTTGDRITDFRLDKIREEYFEIYTYLNENNEKQKLYINITDLFNLH